jgi:hypothetical protein
MTREDYRRLSRLGAQYEGYAVECAAADVGQVGNLRGRCQPPLSLYPVKLVEPYVAGQLRDANARSIDEVAWGDACIYGMT